VVFDYEKFQDEQKKAVMELGKFVKNKLSTEFEKVIYFSHVIRHGKIKILYSTIMSFIKI
jgi:hypothetical protein